MRVSLDGDSTEFAKQIAGLRKILNDAVHGGSAQAKVSARLMLPVLLPFMLALRAELRDEVMPELVMTGAADLLANIALTTVQSMLDAPNPHAEGEVVEQLLTQAIHIAMQSIASEARNKAQGRVAHANGGETH